MIAGKEEIERQKVFGRDHFVYEENSYFIDVNDDSERMWFQNRIGVPNYKWFQEGTGDKHWVLYNPICFMPTKNWNGKKILNVNAKVIKPQLLNSRVDVWRFRSMQVAAVVCSPG